VRFFIQIMTFHFRWNLQYRIVYSINFISSQMEFIELSSLCLGILLWVCNIFKSSAKLILQHFINWVLSKHAAFMSIFYYYGLVALEFVPAHSFHALWSIHRVGNLSSRVTPFYRCRCIYHVWWLCFATFIRISSCPNCSETQDWMIALAFEVLS